MQETRSDPHWILRAAEAALTFRMLPGNVRTMGRAPGADFVVDASLVSRLHCRLEADASGVQVTDLGSTNGTFVNGARVATARLGDGDRLGVGRVELFVSRA